MVVSEAKVLTRLLRFRPEPESRQTVKRTSLAVTLCVALFVTAGFAATKKFQRNNGSRDGNDSSLQNGGLPDAGSSVSTGGVGNLRLSQDAGPLGPPVQNPGSPVTWNGGSGNWSVAGNWTGGEPGSNSDVTIYSSVGDLVTLDVGNTTIESLILGGINNGFTS